MIHNDGNDENNNSNNNITFINDNEVKRSSILVTAKSIHSK